MQRIRTLGIVSILLLCQLTAYGLDWPQWQGPDRSNVSQETDLLKAWPAGGPALKWKATGLGTGYSGVAVVGQRVYTMGDRDDTCYVHALAVGSDKPLWSRAVGKAGAPGWGGYAGPRCTPTVEGDRIYVLGQYGEIACLEAEDGTVVWTQHMESDLGGKRPEWGYSESLLVDGDLVLCTPGGDQGTLAALDKHTGKAVWRSTGCKDGAHYSSIVPADIDGVRQYIQLTAEHVLGVGRDGQVLWTAERRGRTAVIPTPIVAGNRVYVASGYGAGSNLFEIARRDGRFEASQVYATKTMANQHGGVVLIGDNLYGYCDSKGWTCQSLATGKAVWTEKGQVGKGSLTAADGMLYLRSEEKGTVALIKATPDGYQETGRFTQPGYGKPQTWPHPVISDKTLYLRDQDQLLAYDVAGR